MSPMMTVRYQGVVKTKQRLGWGFNIPSRNTLMGLYTKCDVYMHLANETICGLDLAMADLTEYFSKPLHNISEN